MSTDGEDGCFELLEPHREELRSFCRKLCADTPEIDAGDLFQEAVLQATISFDQLDDPEKFKSWLFQIAKRRFYNLAERENVRAHAELKPGLSSSGQPELERRVELEHLLECLKEQHRRALLLHAKGYSSRHIAEKLDTKPGTVRSWISRGRDRLRELSGRDDPERK